MCCLLPNCSVYMIAVLYALFWLDKKIVYVLGKKKNML